jgi:hypothetical protein
VSPAQGFSDPNRGYYERDLGVADNFDDGMMAKAGEVFRLCQSIKREFRRARKQSRAERQVVQALKEAG